MPNFVNPAPESGDSLSVQVNSSGALGARFDNWGRERVGTTPKPVVTVGPGAGTGAVVTSNVGTDADGNVVVTTGSSAVAAGLLATVTFAVPYASTPFVQLQAKDVGGATALVYATASTTAFTIRLVNAPSTSTAYAFDYNVIGGA